MWLAQVGFSFHFWADVYILTHLSSCLFFGRKAQQGEDSFPASSVGYFCWEQLEKEDSDTSVPAEHWLWHTRPKILLSSAARMFHFIFIMSPAMKWSLILYFSSLGWRKLWRRCFLTCMSCRTQALLCLSVRPWKLQVENTWFTFKNHFYFGSP